MIVISCNYSSKVICVKQKKYEKYENMKNTSNTETELKRGVA